MGIAAVPAIGRHRHESVPKTLLPAIKSPELKAFVEKSAPAFQGHLTAAQNLQKRLGYTT